MNRQIPPEAGYAAEQAEAELDTIALHMSHERTNVEQIEALIAELKDRQEAARELLAVAERVLQMPRGPGIPLDFHAAPTRDKRQAEAALAECAGKIDYAQQRLEAVRARMAQLEDRRKALNNDALRAKYRLDELRRRIARPK